MEDSVLALTNQLCEKFANAKLGKDNVHPLNDNHQKERRVVLVKEFKRTCFEYLLRKKPIEKLEDAEDMDTQERLYGEALNIAVRGDSESSQQLIELSDRLTSTEVSVDNVLRFLLALKQSAPQRDSLRGFREIGDNIQNARTRRTDALGVQPYDDRFVFDVDKPTTDSAFRFMNGLKILHGPVGFHDNISKWRYRTTLSSGIPNVFTTDFPSEETQVEEIEVEEDEGYSSPIQPRQESTEIWDEVWKEDVVDRRSWERLREKGIPREKPFLSEAGRSSVHHIWRLCVGNLCLLDPSYVPPELSQVDEETLCLHICYLLAGIHTESFPLNPETDRFEVKPGLCVDGLSPDCIFASCQQYIRSGNTYRDLDNYTNQLESATGSRISAGFCSGISRYLRIFSSAVIFMGSKYKHLGKLHLALRPLLGQIDMLGSICQVKEDPSGWENLPTGVDMLSLLLRVSVHICDDQGNLTLISLFKAAVNPYFKFLKSWLYSGECDFSYKEFGLLMDTRYINNRTVDYWNNTFGLAQLSDHGTAAAFLTEIQEKVFSTGKSLALLKLICPDHHLAGRFRDIQPEFMLAVTADDQVKLRGSVEEYWQRLTEAAKADTLTLKEKKEKERLERIEEARLVQTRHEEAAERIRKEQEEKHQQKIDRQRERYEDLMKQAEEVRSRKERERKRLREADAEIEREAERKLEEERQREAEDRQRITEFYQRLEREAEDRERRAEWRLRRNNPAYKSRRIILHREIEEKEKHRLSRLGVSKSIEQIETDQSVESGLSDIEILVDEMGNFSAKFKDSQGNLISDSLDIFDTFDSRIQNQLTSRTFQQLPDELKNRITHALEFKLAEQKKSANPSTLKSASSSLPRRKSTVTQSSIESLMYENDEMEFPDRNGNIDDVDAVVERVGERKKSAAVPIERLLYPHRYYKQEKKEFKVQKTEIVLKVNSKPLPYTKEFPELNHPSKPDFDDPLPRMESKTFPPLSLILQNSVLVPLRVQQKLVDSALLSNLLVDYQLEQHFSALRRYLFLADGEFGRQLVVSLCHLGEEIHQPTELAGEIRQHLVEGTPPPLLLCPTSLNRVLETALAASLLGSTDTFARNLTFTLREKPEMNLGIPGLSLGYRATWPVNIVLSEAVLKKYSTVLDFMLNIRTTLVSLELDWANENLVLRKDRKSPKSQMHKVNLMRHEMLNFVKNLHSYVSAQVLEVSWLEFQDNLTNKVSNLDELILYHTKYINRVLFRCLLNQKAAPVMNIINNIFISINKFSSLISNRFSSSSSEVWDEMIKHYRAFQKTSKFLFGLVTKLSARGYQPHFQDLLLRLNFNGFYETSLNTSSS